LQLFTADVSSTQQLLAHGATHHSPHKTFRDARNLVHSARPCERQLLSCMRFLSTRCRWQSSCAKLGQSGLRVTPCPNRYCLVLPHSKSTLSTHWLPTAERSRQNPSWCLSERRWLIGQAVQGSATLLNQCLPRPLSHNCDKLNQRIVSGSVSMPFPAAEHAHARKPSGHRVPITASQPGRRCAALDIAGQMLPSDVLASRRPRACQVISVQTWGAVLHVTGTHFAWRMHMTWVGIRCYRSPLLTPTRLAAQLRSV